MDIEEMLSTPGFWTGGIIGLVSSLFTGVRFLRSFDYTPFQKYIYLAVAVLGTTFAMAYYGAWLGNR